MRVSKVATSMTRHARFAGPPASEAAGAGTRRYVYVMGSPVAFRSSSLGDAPYCTIPSTPLVLYPTAGARLAG